MAISGVVVTLGPDLDPFRLAELLADDPQIILGPGLGHRVAAVIDTPSPAEDEAACARLLEIPGVHTVEIAAVHLDDDADADGADVVGMPRLPCPATRSA